MFAAQHNFLSEMVRRHTREQTSWTAQTQDILEDQAEQDALDLRADPAGRAMATKNAAMVALPQVGRVKSAATAVLPEEARVAATAGSVKVARLKVPAAVMAESA